MNKTHHSDRCDFRIGGDCNCDGYHTFDELYEHRIELFMALCRIIDRPTWTSLYHSDGTRIEGWFIMGIDTEDGKQITYHLPMKYYDRVNCVKYSRAPEYDGHTPDDVLKRLAKL